MIHDNTPVIIGVGQCSERVGEAEYRGFSPMDLAGKALAAAISNCEATGEIAPAIDTVAAIRQFEISTPIAQAPFGTSDNPPRSIAQRVGANPVRAILEKTGGHGPQKLVGELAQDIANGASQCAAIVGSEAISTMLTLLGEGEKPDWSEAIGGQIDDRGFGVSKLAGKAVLANGLGGAIPSYALFENARRAALDLSPDEYRQKIAELFAPFTDVAAANPHAAAPVARSAEELAAITTKNRLVAEPYPRLTIAREKVNQSAAIILASAGMARELGIAEDRWVHIHASVDAEELPMLERPDLAASPQSQASVRRALDIAGIRLADVTYFDLYSCFAIAVFSLIDAIKIQPDDPRGLTLTGGLPFFGGAGNNYSAHAIAEAVACVRRDRSAYALVGANGGYMSKYSTGIYFAQPADWSANRWERLPDRQDGLKVLDSYAGNAKIESYTIIPGKRATTAPVAARTQQGRRIAAMVEPCDEATLSAMQACEPIGRMINVSAGENGQNFYSFND